LYLKTNILPRQARDKHRKNSKKDRFSSGDEVSFGKIANLPGKKSVFCWGDFFYGAHEWALDIDRLGTNIGKALKTGSQISHPRDFRSAQEGECERGDGSLSSFYRADAELCQGAIASEKQARRLFGARSFFTQNDHFTKTGSGRTQEKLMEKVHFACFAGKGQGAAGVGRFQV
jgi:hypothetical protein